MIKYAFRINVCETKRKLIYNTKRDLLNNTRADVEQTD